MVVMAKWSVLNSEALNPIVLGKGSLLEAF